MVQQCPGADSRRTPTLAIKKCKVCGNELEIFSNDKSARCGVCGHTEDCRSQSCYQWCAFAKECEKAE